jgi:DNA replication ATP-dependent helicase Dna2
MPSLSKKALSLYFRNSCERQFVFSLYGDPDREKYGLPPRQKSRAGLGLVGKAGYMWQDEKVSELQDVFGHNNVHMIPVEKGNRPMQIPLLTTLPKVYPFQFIVESAYNPDTPTFRQRTGFSGLKDYFGNSISISEARPDIIQILPKSFSGIPDKYPDEHRNPYKLGVDSNGNTYQLAENDGRFRLRVIDVKQSSEPGAHYFAEVVYYSITLSAWLEEHHLNDQYVVIAAPAVWPGSHEASNLTTQYQDWKKKAYNPLPENIAIALEEDLEVATFDVFSPRLRRLLTEEFPALLAKPWEELTWHVDFRCKGCEYMGYPWEDKDGNVTNHPNQCLPTAERDDHLSRVFGLSRGASKELSNHSINKTVSLASTEPNSPVFNEHQGLRAKRTTFPYRALSLLQKQTSIIPKSGGDALMPKWPALHIYLFLDYDLSTAFTASMGIRAFWDEPLPFGTTIPKNEKHHKKWTEKSGDDEVFLIDKPSLEREREELIKLLRHIRQILSYVTKQDDEDSQAGRRDRKTEQSTYQIYLWDDSQRKHLTRLIGRHLPYILADPHIRTLAWLFPPPELLQHAEDATRQSPITLVSTVVANTVAVPVPHHYRLIDVVKTLKPDEWPAPSIHPLYEEPFSDLIPAERIHEWWNRIGRWDERQSQIKKTTQKKVYALNLLIMRLENELKSVLSTQSAPPVVKTPRPTHEMAPQSRLWLEFTRLNIALQSLDVHTIRSMPLHEREARLKSAHLVKRLTGQEEQDALDLLSRSIGKKLSRSNDLFVYQMAPDSQEVNIKPGEFLFALAPDNRYGFLDEHPYLITKGTSLEKIVKGRTGYTIADSGITGVTIEAIERVKGFIALRASVENKIRQLENETELDFSRNVVLDPIHKDFLTKKVRLTLEGIGNPPCAVIDTKTLQALGMPSDTKAGTSPLTPAAEILWQAPSVYAQKVTREIDPIRSELEIYFNKSKKGLDPSQWKAWQDALSRRLSLIWGPPGTGKSHTLRAIVLGAVLDAYRNNYPLRLLITANTYNAIDNVLLDLERELKALLPSKPYALYRLQSKWHPISQDISTKYPDLTNLSLNKSRSSQEIQDLQNRLNTPSGIVIMGCPPQQLHNLALAGTSERPKATIKSWFDYVVMDEASQMDVASSTLVFSKITPAGSCVLAGDDLQLPPVQQAEPPQDLEDLVESTYIYFRRHHSLPPNSLDVNYRSNATIVEFTKLAGYSANLVSYSKDLKLSFSTSLPDQKPNDWPDQLYWTPHWSQFLDPNHPTVCFIYEDPISSQINDFEADSTSALIWLLSKHLANKLENERDVDGSIKPHLPSTIYSSQSFWEKAVGVVTPHRVQMSKIVYRLQQVFSSDSPEDIRNAVDTVERFQGQQRDVIIASFGIGDPDIISSEDEFLFNLNRFNVLTSRARAKAILLITRSLLDHLANDAKILEHSRLIKQFAESFCQPVTSFDLGYIKQNNPVIRHGQLRRV